ncbi:MAG: hypothetical protein J6X35_00445, partial [Bacteroidales bacterium]|nr:hypothetical protein [Bacteroidales bacterium]
ISNLAVRNITFQGEATGVYFSDTITNVELNGCRVLVDTVTTTTYVGVLAYQGSFNRLRILNNYIEGAYYSMYIYGNSTTDYAKNVTVTGNRMHAAYYYGLYSYYVDYDYVSNNVLTNRTKNASNYFYGLRLYYSDADEVAENRINIAAQYTYGLYTYYFNRDSARAGLVANNEIIMHTTTTAYGAYVYYSNVEYIHNSILALGTPGTAYGVYHGATAGYKVHFYNNLFTCFGQTAYPFYLSAVTTVGNDLLLDYNNYYAPQYLGYAGGARSTLADWITYSKDQNAANVQPAFIDNTVDARCLYYTGMTCPAVQNVPNDILGKPRTGSTAMGCYTPAPVSFDAALLSFADWKGSVVIGQSTPVKVRMMNTGSTLPITAAQVNWTVNGIAQTPYKWTGSLAPYKDTVFSIGGYLPVNGVNNVVAWLSNQNGIAAGDSVPDNDTIRNYAFGCKAAMGGTYRIGKDANADFATPELALTMLSYCGLNAPVVLMLDSGTYDPLSISGNFQGISGKNTVTITSATGKASDVVFTNGSPVITFDQGANHFRLDRVTVDGTSSTYGIYVGSATSDIRITHCQINMDLLSSATTYGIYCTTNTRRDSIWLIGNHVDGGYYNVYFYNGTSSNSTDHGRY